MKGEIANHVDESARVMFVVTGSNVYKFEGPFLYEYLSECSLNSFSGSPIFAPVHKCIEIIQLATLSIPVDVCVVLLAMLAEEMVLEN